MKKIISLFILMIVTIIVCMSTVQATSKEDLINYLASPHVVAGKTVQLSSSQMVKVKRYLDQYEITSEQANAIIGKAEQAIALMNKANVSNPKQLSKEDQNKLMSLVSQATSNLELSVNYNTTSEEISISKDGKLIDVVQTNQTKLVQTGYDYTNVIIVSAIVSGVLLCYIVIRKELKK